MAYWSVGPLVQVRRGALREGDDHSPPLDQAADNFIKFLDWFISAVIFEGISALRTYVTSACREVDTTLILRVSAISGITIAYGPDR
jgi:hypothetical protein